ncbi:MAG: zinc-dependent dehydrogenase [Acidobacteriota bacterium]|nr:zinc-dependent dehydrogenase [Acidobacteriota bacterium]
MEEIQRKLQSGMMRAAVYRGPSRISVEKIPIPEIGDGEMLVRIYACGVCGTDLKKIEYGLVPPPRVFGHEMAGVVAKVGAGVAKFKVGDRVVAHHHIPCKKCFYCERNLFSQCEFYRRTGTTAGFEPAGGGFAEFIRVMDWIVESGTVLIPDNVSYEEASFLEPLNTCVRALETAELQPGETVVIYGQGPVGLMLTQAAAVEGARVIGLDFLDARLDIARELGAAAAFNPRNVDAAARIAEMTDGRGADLAIVAAANPDAVGDAQRVIRRGGRVMLFAQTVPGEKIPVDVAAICMEEKKLIGSYSASVELQDKTAELVFSGKVNVGRLISHRLGLEHLLEGIHLALNPSANSLKVVIQP